MDRRKMFITMLWTVWLYITPEIGVKEIFKGRKLALGLDGRSENRRFVFLKNSLEPIRNKTVDRELFLEVQTKMKQIREEKLGNGVNFWIH